MSEETQNPSRNVPNAMTASMVTTYILGYVAIILLLLSIDPQEGQVIASHPFAVGYILTRAISLRGAIAICCLLIGALVIQVLAQLQASTRFVFAQARDHALPFSDSIQWTNSAKQPVVATWLVVGLCAPFCLLLIGSKHTLYSVLAVTASTLSYIGYTVPAALYLFSHKNLETEGRTSWTLRKLSKPVAVVGVLFGLLVITVSCLPGSYPVNAFQHRRLLHDRRYFHDLTEQSCINDRPAARLSTLRPIGHFRIPPPHYEALHAFQDAPVRGSRRERSRPAGVYQYPRLDIQQLLPAVDASFHQVARGLVLPFTILVTIFFLRQHSSPLSLAAALVVTSGFFSGLVLDPSHSSSSSSSGPSSSSGIVFGVLSSACSAFHAILIKKGLTVVDNSPVALAFYNNILSMIALIPLIFLSGEYPAVLRLLTGEGVYTFAVTAGLTGIFGFLINLAASLSIKITSPVTHMISSASRGVLQTILAVYFFDDILSRGRILSIFLIISGSMLYVYCKHIEAPRPMDDIEGALGKNEKE
ncbi:solute carrier family 35 (GDP-fucose transporter), member C1, partial [Tremellales sp. Uapishka_1]